MFGPNRTVLLLSDEGVAVCGSVRGRFDVLGELGWTDHDFSESLKNILVKQGAGRPVMVLYDMVEQYYRKELVPSNVALLDRQGILKRKLAATFPNYSVRSALPLKASSKNVTTDKKEKTQAGLTGKPYLFAAIPESDHIRRVTEVIRDSQVSLVGIFLLPVESVSLVQQLSSRLDVIGTRDSSRWIVMLSQHRGGGLRQIVVRNGELALTRLTPVVDTDIEPQMWATEVAQEFNSTMGYLSRFGYTPQDELEVITIGTPQSTATLEEIIKIPRFYGLTVPQAAKKLGLPLHNDVSVRHGDLLHSSWLARKLSFTLPLHSAELAFIRRARQMAAVAAALLFMTTSLGGGYAIYIGWGLYQSYQELEDRHNHLARLETEYQEEINRKESYNIDVKLVRGSVRITKNLEQNKIDLIEFLKRISQSMEPDLRLDDVNMSYVEEQVANPDPMAAEVLKEISFVTTLKMSFDPSMLPELANKVLSDLKDSISKNLPEYDVFVSQAAKDLTYAASFTYEAGLSATKDTANQRLVGEVTIKQKKHDQNTGS